MYIPLGLTFLLSFIVTKIVVSVAVRREESGFGLDNNSGAVQRMHSKPVPRIGGLAIFISMVFTALYGSAVHATWGSMYAALIMSVFFVFIGGLAEDLSGRVTPVVRMLFMMSAVVFTIYALSSMNMIRNLEHETLNQFLSYEIIAFIITCFAVVGISNAYNMIDGYNGLSSFTAMINLLGLSYLGYHLGDFNIVFCAAMLVAAIAGFFVFNYPFGKIFLGDGGSYTIGFLVSLISLNLVGRHIGAISPFTVLLLVAYPFTETIFTIFRRKFIHKTRAMQPDCLHLHQLIFSRCFHEKMSLLHKNARVMPIAAIMMIPQTVCAILWYDNTMMILLSLLAYWVFYVYVYVMLIKFKTPLLFKCVAYFLTKKMYINTDLK